MTNEQQALSILKKAVFKADTQAALEFLRNTGKRPVILCDNSGSMSSYDGLETTRLNRLNNELRTILSKVDATVIAFNDTPTLSVVPIPTCGGGTDMAAALRFAHTLQPSQIVLISDGLPNSRTDTLQARQILGPTRLDVIFVGNPTDTDARDFLSSLATSQVLTSSTDLTIAGQLAQQVIGILTDGSPTQSIAL